jgi:4,5-dihydroxyphthalate decarboxylase
MKLKLSLGVAANPRTRPVLEGAVKPEGIDFIPSVVDVAELFWRQMKFADFDVSEMSVSSLMVMKALGDEDWVGLPIFTTRRFFHTNTWVRKDSGINTPADLKGKRIGVPEYQQTAALWTRGAFEHEWGVSPREMIFHMERVATHSHAGATAFKPPPGVTIHFMPPEKSIGSMMDAGELDVAICYNQKKTLIDRSLVDLANHPDIKPMFADNNVEGARYRNKTGLLPINHGMVIRRSILEKHPWAALNILAAFNEANAIADRQRIEHNEYYFATGIIPPEAVAAVRQPLIHHGVVANRKVLETIAAYSFEQGLTPRLMKVEELFAKSTINQ